MFTADMIAPCGLDCSLCRKAHDKVQRLRPQVRRNKISIAIDALTVYVNV